MAGKGSRFARVGRYFGFFFAAVVLFFEGATLAAAALVGERVVVLDFALLVVGALAAMIPIPLA